MPGLVSNVLGRAAVALGYDAIEDVARRRVKVARTMAEDKILTDRKRERLNANARDVMRNFTIAGWMVRKHLDYVSSFSFQAKNESAELNEQMEDLMARWSDRQRCDVARRHPLRRMIRLAEQRRVVDGDFLFLKLAPRNRTSQLRGKLQGIETDRIINPSNLRGSADELNWVNGVRLSPGGAALAYNIRERESRTAKVQERVVQARNVFTHGFYDRFDQVRGVSPLMAALNSLRDIYEGFDYALAKVKVSQMFGLVMTRDTELGLTGATNLATQDADADGIRDSDAEIDFGKGPVMLDLDPGEDAKVIEAKTPATETVAFLELMTQAVIKALDLPYSFFDESHSTFYGSRGGLIQYLKSCKSKIADMQDLLNAITQWRLGLFVEDGELQLPGGMLFEDLEWEWVPDGVPWWDPSKEVKGHAMAIAAGLDNFQHVCRLSGTDFIENIDKNAAAIQYANSKGVTLTLPGAIGSDTSTDDGQDEEVDEDEREIQDGDIDGDENDSEE